MSQSATPAAAAAAWRSTSDRLAAAAPRGTHGAAAVGRGRAGRAGAPAGDRLPGTRAAMARARTRVRPPTSARSRGCGASRRPRRSAWRRRASSPSAGPVGGSRARSASAARVAGPSSGRRTVGKSGTSGSSSVDELRVAPEQAERLGEDRVVFGAVTNRRAARGRSRHVGDLPTASRRGWRRGRGRGRPGGRPDATRARSGRCWASFPSSGGRRRKPTIRPRSARAPRGAGREPLRRAMSSWYLSSTPSVASTTSAIERDCVERDQAPGSSRGSRRRPAA